MEIFVDKNSPVPSHYQLCNALKAMIVGGQIPPGARLPSENELGRLSGVSRLTVRQAVQLLCDGGLARKVRNRGTFVRKVRLGSPSGTINSFSGSIRDQGFVPRAQIVSFEAAAPLGAEMLERFAHVDELDMEQHFIRILRVVFANDVPIIVSDHYLNASLKLHVDADTLGEGSLYALLTKQGSKVHEADQVVELGVAAREEAALLGLSAKTSLLIAHRADFSVDGALVGLARNIFHPTACKLRHSIVGAGLMRVHLREGPRLRAA